MNMLFNNDETIIYNIKYALEHEEYQDFIEKIEEQIKLKNEELLALGKNNSAYFMENLKNFFNLKTMLFKYKTKISDFDENLQKISMRNKYDKIEITQKKKMLENINLTISLIFQVQEILNSFIKAISNLKNDKNMASIRILGNIKKKPLMNNNSNVGLKKIYADIFPIIHSRIHNKLDGLMIDWLKINKIKQIELGTNTALYYEDMLNSSKKKSINEYSLTK